MSKKKMLIENRVRKVARYILNYEATMRETAKEFGVSKSTIHKDLVERLPQINPKLAERTRIITEYNKSMRHIRGGITTQKRWELKKAA